MAKKPSQQGAPQGDDIMDIAVLAIGIGFFALLFGYLRVCEKL
ncbi:hypothetical protein [Brucella haematophila]|nr:hypothetical protein [Brucella haematophila]